MIRTCCAIERHNCASFSTDRPGIRRASSDLRRPRIAKNCGCRGDPEVGGGGTLPVATGALLGRGAFSFYRSQLSSQSTLTPEQEHDLALRWRAGDRDAGRKMIE